MNEKAKLKVALQKFLNAHLFTVEMNLLCEKMIYNTVL